MTINRHFATIYLLINSDKFIKQTEVITLLHPLLSSFQTNQEPVIANFEIQAKPDDSLENGITVLTGPFKGLSLFSGYKLSAVKWNFQKKTNSNFTEESLGKIREQFRSITKKEFALAGFDVIQMSVNHYGKALAGDKGFPKTPSLPVKPLPVTPPIEKPADMTFTFSEIDAYNKRVPKKSNKPLWILAAIMGIYAARRGM
jgi:hypothetical protein